MDDIQEHLSCKEGVLPCLVSCSENVRAAAGGRIGCAALKLFPVSACQAVESAQCVAITGYIGLLQGNPETSASHGGILGVPGCIFMVALCRVDTITKIHYQLVGQHGASYLVDDGTGMPQIWISG